MYFKSYKGSKALSMILVIVLFSINDFADFLTKDFNPYFWSIPRLIKSA